MHNLRKTKIVATIGPASSDEKKLTEMIKAGMNVARINCSHGTQDEYRADIERIRRVSAKLKIPVAIILDLGGPKIRIGDFKEKTIMLKKGAYITLTTEKIIGDESRVSVNYSRLPKEVRPGMRILLDDGKRELEVISVHSKDVLTKIIYGGEIHGHRGVNIPDADLTINTITKKDLNDIAFGIAMNVDFIALSFVRSPKDIAHLKYILNGKKSAAGVIAKIETRPAMDNIDAIIKEASGIMVARGDLAVEIGKEDVPLAQKTIIRKCNAEGKAVITATHMLDSMASHPSPTRAEVNDVANAIFDGTDAIMLSAETAIGIDPALAVETMSRIALRIESSDLYHEEIMHQNSHPVGIVDSVSSSVSRIVRTVNASAIVAMTGSGFTARTVSRHKPIVPILALTPLETTYRQLALSYGCYPVKINKEIRRMRDALYFARKELIAKHYAKKGDTYVLVAGIPFGQRTGSNGLVVQKI